MPLVRLPAVVLWTGIRISLGGEVLARIPRIPVPRILGGAWTLARNTLLVRFASPTVGCVGAAGTGDGSANHNCGNGGHNTVGDGVTVEVDCAGTLARYVNVRIPGGNKILTLCEVKVTQSSPTRSAGPCSRLPTASPNLAAGRAVDGNTNPSFSNASCSSTVSTRSTKNDGTTDPWWRVDLGAQHYSGGFAAGKQAASGLCDETVQTAQGAAEPGLSCVAANPLGANSFSDLLLYICTVRITNRGDCCPERLDGFEVRAGGTEGDGTANHNCGNGGHATVGASATVDVSCSGQLA
eukprot:gene57063-biopygen53807